MAGSVRVVGKHSKNTLAAAAVRIVLALCLASAFSCTTAVKQAAAASWGNTTFFNSVNPKPGSYAGITVRLDSSLPNTVDPWVRIYFSNGDDSWSELADSSGDVYVPEWAVGYHVTGMVWDDSGYCQPSLTFEMGYVGSPYTVTFVDGVTGETISTTTVAHGKAVTLPDPPEHENYAFVGWDSDGTNITGPTTITAQYQSTGHDVAFVDGVTGQTIETQRVDHGSNVTFPDAPAHEGWTFVGWSSNGVGIVADETITAEYERIECTLTFVDGVDETTLETRTVEYGTPFSPPSPPEHEGYEFIGWDFAESTVTNDAVITALYSANIIVRVPTSLPCGIMPDGTIVAPGEYAIENLSVVPVAAVSIVTVGMPEGISYTVGKEGSAVHSYDGADRDKAALTIPAKGKVSLQWSFAGLDRALHADIIAKAAAQDVPLCSIGFVFDEHP